MHAAGKAERSPRHQDIRIMECVVLLPDPTACSKLLPVRFEVNSTNEMNCDMAEFG